MTTVPRFERIAHRGMPRERRENTLEGFLLALERGAQGIELDVHATADGRVVVHHDSSVNGQIIARSTWSDIRALDLGGGARIPLLDDVLEAVGDRATLYVELKGDAVESHVLRVITTRPSKMARVALHSFDHAAVARVARLAPEVARGVLLDRGTSDAPRALEAAVRATGARDAWPHWSLVDAPLVAAARECGARVIAWTVNEPGAARRLAAFGVDGLCTDDVTLLATL